MAETKYKQTEVGLIPEEWECKKLGELLSIGNGRDYKHLSNGNIPVFGTGGLMCFVNECLYDGETVCIGRKGTIDTPFYYNGKIWTVDTLFYTYGFNNLIPKFAYYLFWSIDWLSKNEATGVPSLSKINIEQIKVSLPPLAEQQVIASALTSIDNLIASLDKLIAKTQSVKQGAMQQLLTGLNTEDVTWKPLGEVVNFSDGFPFDSSSFRSSGKYAVIRISDLSNYNVVRGDKYIEYLPAKIKEEQILGGGEILIAMSGSTGKVGYNKSNNFVVNQRIAIIRSKDNVLRGYLKQILLNSKFEEYCFKQGTGIQNNIGKDVILDYLIPYPSLETQHRIASTLTAIDDQISALEAKRKKYEMVKVGMMQQLLTGKVRLK